MGERTPGGQDRKGHLLEDSPNDTKKTGRAEGRPGPQKKLGHRQSDGGENAETRTRPFDGFDFAGNLALQDGKLSEEAITNPSKQGDRVGAQDIGEGE
jgi:hypothetical protein